MTGGGDGQPKDGPDIESEIDRTMAEAEAAVTAVRGDEDDPTGDEAEDSDEDLHAALEQAKAATEATRDKWLRSVADLDNYKKRTKREIDEAVMRSTQSLLAGFLPSIDNLERALEIAPASGVPDPKHVEQLVKGIKMVRDEFLASLAKQGISPVASVGTVFDPAIHDALQQFDSPDHAPGMVIREFEKGYRIKDRLLRPARVIVAGAGSTGEPPSEPSENPEESSE